jgi:hypothetical protein
MATIGSRVNNVVRLQMPDENVTPLYHLVHGWMFELFQRQRGPMKRVEEVDKLLEPRFWNLRDLAQLVLCFEDLDDLVVHVENAAQAAQHRVPPRRVFLFERLAEQALQIRALEPLDQLHSSVNNLKQVGHVGYVRVTVERLGFDAIIRGSRLVHHCS